MKNITHNNLQEFLKQFQAAVQDGSVLVEDSATFHAGYWRCLVQKEFKPEDVQVIVDGHVITGFSDEKPTFKPPQEESKPKRPTKRGK